MLPSHLNSSMLASSAVSACFQAALPSATITQSFTVAAASCTIKQQLQHDNEAFHACSHETAELQAKDCRSPGMGLAWSDMSCLTACLRRFCILTMQQPSP